MTKAEIIAGYPSHSWSVEQYDNHHPYAKDVLLLMEIADVSLEKDRTLKRYIYAISGIKEYWIIDITGRKIEQYLSPQKDGSFD